MTTELGRLVKVSLRQAWSSEAGDFTPWLARAENLKLLGDSIGLALECDSQEKRVGPFRADILCKDSDSGNWVLIENQLERTDHSHLGQLLTYASGLEAVTVVWVAERFTEEHRAALDWLNERTDEKIHFFGLEVELWQIGDSQPAPKFNVVCKPNEWTRMIAESAKSLELDELSEHRQAQYQFWTDFLTLLRSRKQVIESRTPQASTAMTFPVGHSGFRLWAEMYVRDNAIGVGITCKPPHAKFYFNALREEAAAIERELGFELDWDERPEKVHSFIARYTEAEPMNRKTWPQLHVWLAETLEQFQRVFGERAKRLPDPQ